MSIIHMRGAKEAPRSEQSKMETLLLTPAILSSWVLPDFQRALKVNQKVREVGQLIADDGGIIPGIITLGILKGDRATTYLLDGQHRREAALLSECKEFIADIRVIAFDTMPAMAQEYVRLNSQIVRLKPDDILRGLEGTLPAIAKIRNECPFVGYGYIRRNTTSPILGMSVVIRCWNGSTGDTPNPTTSGKSAGAIAEEMTSESAEHLVRFLVTARAAWGDDVEYSRLWGTLNLTIIMWLWRQLVLNQDRSRGKRVEVLNIDTFKKCLMSLSASNEYLDWLIGRNMSERDRSPCYMRIKSMFQVRLADLLGKKPILPQPSWSSK